jgi:hypothetical protein
MDSPKNMDIGDWQDSPLPIVPKARIRRQFLPPTLIGIFGTLLLHALVIQSVSFGSRDPKQKWPEAEGSTSARAKSIGDADSLVFISLPTSVKANEATSGRILSSPLDLSKLKINLPINTDLPELFSLEILPLNEDQALRAVASAADGAEQARLFGIYTGQIQARIDRVWRRPRTPVNEDNVSERDAGDSFQCEAQIVQDIRGNVQEVLLPRCNGSAAWQRSLVLAIQHASPLPAPPSDTVFSRSINLTFLGLNYFAGASQDDYEPERRTLMGAQVPSQSQ